MHVAFVHQTYPSQFGHVARALADRHGWRTTFVCRNAAGRDGPVECVQYHLKGGATEQTHFCSRTFENGVWHSAGVYEAFRGRPDLRPDLVVGHSGFGSTAFLPKLVNCPIINYFEYYYQGWDSDIDFRPDFPPTEVERLRATARNAMIQLDLEGCAAGYSPTKWQRDLLPAAYRGKVRAIFDGVDTGVWKPAPRGGPRTVAGHTFPEGTKLLTYSARGFEAMRGFDIFVEVARRVTAARPDVVVLVVGEDKVFYGGDTKRTGGRPFGAWTLERSGLDRSRCRFLGRLPPAELAHLMAVGDCHVYLTVPFILSWSLLDALACGAAVVASDVAPVREMIRHDETGLLADFFDAKGLADHVLRVLAEPDTRDRFGRAGAELVRAEYALDVCLPRLKAFYEEVARGGRPAG
jgi:glycosyltransferase involved in cell wall biosynthesis